jgi:FHA domain-containing protein
MPPDVVLFILRLLVAVALYAFLSALLYFVWQDFSLAQRQMESSLRPSGWLVVVESEDATVRKGRRFPLRWVTTIGRAPTSTLVLNNPFTSSAHAQIIARNNRWWLEDLKSRNGTILNDMPVDEAVVLTTGDIIQIGTVKLLFDLEEQSP